MDTREFIRHLGKLMEDGHDLTDDEIQEVLFILMADYWQRGLD